MTLATPAWAADLSPTTVDSGKDVAFAVTAAAGVDLLQTVAAELPSDFSYLGCNAPAGWSCGLDGSTVRWNRDTSLSGQDTTFGMTLTTPDTSGDRIFTLSEQRASGSASSSNAVVTVVAAETEPSGEPSAEASADPSPEVTAEEVVDDQPPPPVEPFRPPDGEDPPPISIRDLPDVESSEAAVATSNPGGGFSTTTLVVAPIALLLMLSFGGFITAALNR